MLAQRVADATPHSRDRAVDALRAFAILGVVLGHWLVTALVSRGQGALAVVSPLRSLPLLTPVTWLLQTLAVFFLVGGYTVANAGAPYLPWLRRRLGRLARPVPALLLAWVPLTLGLWAMGVTADSLRSILKLVLSPLWFLGVYAALTALAPVFGFLWHRLGLWSVALPLAVTALVDVTRFALAEPAGPAGPAGLGWINLVAGWSVPFLLGVGWARGAFTTRRLPVLMAVAGTAATLLLIRYASYPGSMVGVPGTPVSNLNPPTLAAVTFGIAQAGLALLLRGPLTRWLRRPRPWAAVALANLSAMTVFLWHQTAMLLVTVGALTFGLLPGLHTVPDDPAWVAARLLWLPAFAAALTACWSLFHRYER
ncbi:MAG: acyltransferase [Streptosporangiaceae bacterium]